MARHDLLAAMRYLVRQKMYTIINIAGLAIGMACCVILLLFVRDEWRYDRYHEHRDRIYRVAFAWRHPVTQVVAHGVKGPYRLASILRREMPEIPHTVRFFQQRVVVRHGHKQFYETRVFAADPNVFDVFTFPLLRGDPRTVFEHPFSVVITPEMAHRYFGDADPMGKTLRIHDQFDVTVTGILQPMPRQSHFRFDLLASLPQIEPFLSPIQRNNLTEGVVYTYLMLPSTRTAAELEKQFPSLIDTHWGAGAQSWIRLYLQPLTDIRLRSHTASEIEPNGNIVHVYAAITLAIFLLLIACTNYINLATARAASRARDVALRKAIGASRSQLVMQFLGESLCLTYLALLLAIACVEVALPAVNALSGKSLALKYGQDAPLLGGLIALAAGVGLLSGSYPAAVLSAFSPVAVWRGLSPFNPVGARGRKILVVVQFTIGTALAIATVILYQQLHFMRTRTLGYAKAHVVAIDEARRVFADYEAFKSTLLEHPHITGVARASRIPPDALRSNIPTRPEGHEAPLSTSMQTVWTDHDFLNVLGIDLVKGRYFSAEVPSDAEHAFILNESAVRALGWERPIGKGFGSQYIRDGTWHWQHGTVIGVVKDAHLESLHQPIVPTVYFIDPPNAWNLIVRMQPQELQQTLAFVQQTWERFTAHYPFRFSFLDKDFEQLYRAEARQGQVLVGFAILAVVIACLGLFGLAAFLTEQRTKEIGIRKALGASVPDIVIMLAREFTFLVLLAIVLACPIAYVTMQAWLSNFAYHITIGPGPFIGGGALALIEAWGTVCLQAMRAARANPVDALRYE